ncbi:CoA pyrophosphatase [Catenovulum sp. SM1970]|uniref:NUDIX hydrolase n=1 Tax=Marinifaba aquimaris TaxID=2741323 RepID=UPI001571D8F3|nr:CoA pyrophosphatase [Marinifaba aquimaris]NTS77631.1 CoA pyrophosphatase [Marinifaba aquimaris]
MDWNNIEHLSSKVTLHHSPADAVHPLVSELKQHDEFKLKKSAVTIPLVNNPKLSNTQGISILLTKRQDFLRSHPGQISFPGGKFDENLDNQLLDTALRESDEEIGIKANQQQLITQLHTFNTLTGFSIEPYLTYVQPNVDSLVLNEQEVEKPIFLPLKHLIFEQELLVKNIKRTFKGRHFSFDVYFMPFQGQLIWGATAGILIDLCTRLTSAQHTQSRLIRMK